MPLPLVELEEACRFLGIDEGTADDLIEELLASVQSLFEKEVGRSLAPYGTAQTARTEIHEGHINSSVLTLDYPISTVTSIGLGLDVAVPDETLIPASAASVVWRVGGRDLIRTDGGVWRRTLPRWVKVVYNTLADQPNDVKLAIKRMVATLYNARTHEGFTSETRGARSWTMAQGIGTGTRDAFWEQAVANHRLAWLR